MSALRKYWLEVVILILVFVVAWYATKLCSSDTTMSFCNGFLGNLFSDFIIAVLIGFFFLRLIDSRDHPDLALVVDGDLGYEISKTSATKDGFVLHLGVLNKNRNALHQKDGFYHILINKELSPELRRGTTGQEMEEKDVHGLPDFVEFHDQNPGPVLENSSVQMIDISCKLHTDINESIIYYFFNTESGIYPKGAKFKGDKLENIKTWGKLKIKFV